MQIMLIIVDVIIDISSLYARRNRYFPYILLGSDVGRRTAERTMAADADDDFILELFAR